MSFGSLPLFLTVPFLLVGGLLVGGPATAEIYRWVDADGNVHYGDRRPDQSAETLDIESSASTPDPTSASATGAAATDEFADALRIVTDAREFREETEREREATAAEREQHRVECERMAAYRQRLADGGFLFRRNDPERKALSDAEIAADLAEVDRSYRESCI